MPVTDLAAAAWEDGVYCLECDVRPTVLGLVLRVQLERYDDAAMGWEELHAAFVRRYPGRWAVQCFPPPRATMNGAHKYHLFVLDQPPVGLDLSQDPPSGTRAPESR